MKRKVLRITGCLLLFVMLAGCQSRALELDLKICGSYGVPGMYHPDLKGKQSQCQVLETDSQGRVLFSYTTDSVITGQEETALVVCQRVDARNVYFYEDICYVMEPLGSADTAALKEANDWEHPLDEEKMSARSRKISVDNMIVADNNVDFMEMRDACCKKMGIDQTQIREFCFLDASGDEALCWLELGEADLLRQYYVLSDAESNIAWMENATGDVEPAVIAAFKQENGWTY